MLYAGSQRNYRLNIDLLSALILLKNSCVGGDNLNNVNTNIRTNTDTEWKRGKLCINFLAKH